MDTGDIGPFALALTDPAGYLTMFPACDIARADLNGDGSNDGRDVHDFTSILVGP